MKLKAFLEKLKADGKITAPEFQAAIESAPEFDFSDKAVEAFENTFLTIDRAAAHKDVNRKIRFEVLNPADTELAALMEYHIKDYIDPLKLVDFKKEENTYNKIKLLHQVLPEAFKKIKTTPATDEDTKKKLKTAEDTVQELMNKLETVNTEYSKKEKTLEDQFNNKISDFQINLELEKLANSFKFGKAFADDMVRKDITKVKLDGLRGKHSLKLVTNNGQAQVQVTDKEGKPLFNGNSAVTINQLLEDEFKPYIKASNAGDEEEEPEQPQTNKFNVNGSATKPRTGTRTTVQ